LHLVGYLYYWQMGFNSVFKGLNAKKKNWTLYSATAVLSFSATNDVNVRDTLSWVYENCCDRNK